MKRRWAGAGVMALVTVCVAVLVVMQVDLCAPPARYSRLYFALGCPRRPVS
jgi:hypothetical protein